MLGHNARAARRWLDNGLDTGRRFAPVGPLEGDDPGVRRLHVVGRFGDWCLFADWRSAFARGLAFGACFIALMVPIILFSLENSGT